MSDIGDDFRALREMGKAKRSSNRGSSAALLAGRGISYEAKNDGAHLVVRHAGKTVDFWPGTGLWIARGGRRGRGIHPLMAFLTA